MYLLSIETSCDETAMSLVKVNKKKNNFKVLRNITISQINIHAQFGGVFPALAKREHKKNLPLLFQEILKEPFSLSKIDKNKFLQSNLEKIIPFFEREKEMFKRIISFLKKQSEIQKIDAIAVTQGPGLAPALWTGVNFARILSYFLSIPLFPINHMEGHVSSILLKENFLNIEEALFPLNSFSFPMLALLISGGHTQLVYIKEWGEYKIIGETLDDAVGESFDKVARMLGMEYPGGPKLSAIAKKGKKNEEIVLPRPMLHSRDYRFSFSGLKTAVRYLVENLKKKYGENLPEQIKNDIAREFEHSIVEVLLTKTKKAVKEFNVQTLIIAGGVSANSFLRKEFQKTFENIELLFPTNLLCGDNALMIASAALLKIQKGERGMNWKNLEAKSRLRIGEKQ